MSVILGLESTPERALAASIDKRDREIVHLNEVIRRLDTEMAEWHEKVLRQERVIEAAREIVRRPYADPVAVRIQRDIDQALVALEGKPRG